MEVSLPDDAFYYFVLAKHRATIGHWTFDGVAPATGFHLLWAYSLSAIYRLADWSLLSIFTISSLIGAGCMSVAAWLLSKLLIPDFGWAGGAAVVLIFLGESYFLLPSMAMEAPLVIMSAALCGYAVFVRRSHRLALISGLLGELSRSDFGLMPFGLLAARAVTSRTLHHKRPHTWSCAGAVIGLCLNLVHTYLISGHFLQNSALMKAHWSELAGNATGPSVLMLGDIFYLGSGAVGVLLFILFGAASAWDARKNPQRSTLWVASAIITIGYVAVYRNNSQEIQPWYLASFILPAIFFAAGTLRLLSRVLPRVALTATVVVLASPTLLSCYRPIYPHMLIMAEAGKELAHQQGLAGSWNAGVIGYYNYDRTVNLDGLVNDDILPYAKSGSLLQYIQQRRIATIADFAVMMNQQYSLRGGYSDGRLAACLVPGHTIGVPNVTPWKGTPLTVYSVRCIPEIEPMRKIAQSP